MSWICDSCGQPIEKVEDGYVEWLTRGVEPEDREARGLRIVHNYSASPRGAGRCQYDERAEFADGEWTVSDVPLDYMIGPDGLMYLLSMLPPSELSRDELAEVIKRLHVPKYEQARPNIVEAVAERVIDADPEGFLSQEQLQAVIDWARKHGI